MINSPLWQQAEQLELSITDLSDDGGGVSRSHNRIVFVADTVPGDRIRARLIKIKPNYAVAKLEQILTPSQWRIRPACIVADKCGGCQWQHIDYEYQRQAKRNLVIQTLERIGGFKQPVVDSEVLKGYPLKYRNKVTYPVQQSVTGQIKAGYYQQGSHRLINLNQCPIQDPQFNPLLANIKQDIQRQGWSIYDEQQHTGTVRHLGLRVGRRTGEILLTLVVRNRQLPGIETQAEIWMQQYPQLVGICLNFNPDKTNAIFGQQIECVRGQSFLQEQFAGLTFHLKPETFFQVNTEVAEALINIILDELNLKGDENIIDAFCGIGTLTLPLAKQLQPSSGQVIGIETQSSAIQQAEENADFNQIKNVKFIVGKVQNILSKLEIQPDIVLLDPPRKGCDPVVIDTLLKLKPQQIVYISCKPSTLARDLKLLCQTDVYQLKRVQLADFFPQTSHVEVAAFLVKKP
ncbi:MAG: 23S rRNA (uracil(1939)-C(5))-methyltransferase RlmD [Microcoleaceae cyanobacterium]